MYRSPSLSIVVIRLTDELDTKVQVCYHESSKYIYSLPDHLLLTNQEFIIRMCQIASSSAESGGSIPYVMIVKCSSIIDYKDNKSYNIEINTFTSNIEL